MRYTDGSAGDADFGRISLGDFLEQTAETLGEPLFGTSNGPTGGLLPSYSCQTRIRWPH